MGLPARSWPHTVERIPVNGTGVAVLLLRAAVPGRAILLVSYHLTISAAAGLEFRSGTTPLSGRMVYGANGQATGALSGAGLVGLFRTADGEALNLDVDAAVDVDGHVEIVIV